MISSSAGAHGTSFHQPQGVRNKVSSRQEVFANNKQQTRREDFSSKRDEKTSLEQTRRLRKQQSQQIRRRRLLEQTRREDFSNKTHQFRIKRRPAHFLSRRAFFLASNSSRRQAVRSGRRSWSLWFAALLSAKVPGNNSSISSWQTPYSTHIASLNYSHRIATIQQIATLYGR